MHTSSPLDLAALLTPISAEFPTGQDIRTDSTSMPLLHQLKELRLMARTIERQHIRGIEKTAKADWQAVREIAVNLLQHHTKDLEIAAWLTEALLREHRFHGLYIGFHFMRELCEKFWDTLHPLPDEDGFLTRVIALTHLNGEEVEGTLIVPIALTPLTEGAISGPYNLWQYRQALDLLKITDPQKREQRLAAGSISLEIFETAIHESSASFVKEQHWALTHAIHEFNALLRFLEQHCGEETPPSSRILAQLNACLECLETVGKRSLQSLTVSDSTTNETVTPSHSITDTSNHSRDQVLESLLQAAHFFRSTEPHSPLPYILERAVRWGRMSLPELLQELITDETARQQFDQLTGVTFN